MRIPGTVIGPSPLDCAIDPAESCLDFASGLAALYTSTCPKVPEPGKGPRTLYLVDSFDGAVTRTGLWSTSILRTPYTGLVTCHPYSVVALIHSTAQTVPNATFS